MFLLLRIMEVIEILIKSTLFKLFASNHLKEVVHWELISKDEIRYAVFEMNKKHPLFGGFIVECAVMANHWDMRHDYE